jgi:ABC-type multidrug transport system permease subunit
MEFFRDPGVIFWVFGFPIVMALILGVAFRNKPPERIQVVLVDNGADAAWAQGLLDAVPEVEARIVEAKEANRQLDKGQADLLLIAARPAGFRSGRIVEVGPILHYRYDPDRPPSRYARGFVDDALQRALGRKDPAASREERVTRPGSRYIDFLVPGLIGQNLMGSGMWGVGFVIVDTRKRKLLKRFAATPMRKSHFLLSYILSRLFFLFLEVGAIVAFGHYLFGVSVQGSWFDVLFLAVLGSFAFTALGLLIATRPQSHEAASGWMNLVMVPMWFCSGVFFSYERFPEILQPLIRALPLTALNDALRAVMNDAAGLSALGPQILNLGLWAGLCFALAMRFFRWQ